MKHSRRNRLKIAAGIVLPALLGWVSLAFLGVLSAWSSHYVLPWFAQIPLQIAWFAIVPVGGWVMGVLSAVLWRDLEPTPAQRRKWSSLSLWACYAPFLLLFGALVVFIELPWEIVLLFGLPLLALMMVLFLIHGACFLWGQTRGEQWLEDGALKRFFDLDNSP